MCFLLVKCICLYIMFICTIKRVCTIFVLKYQYSVYETVIWGGIKGDITLNTIRLWYRYYSPFSNPFTILHITFVNIVLDCDGEETQIQVVLTVYVVSLWLWLYNSEHVFKIRPNTFKCSIASWYFTQKGQESLPPAIVLTSNRHVST